MMRVDLAGLRRLLRVVLLVSLILAILLILECAARRQVGYLRAQLILTLLGVSVGSILALIDTWVMRSIPRIASLALGFLAISQVTFYLLVWTAAKKNDLFLRIWWVFVVASLTSTHLAGPQQPTGTRP